MHGVKEVCNVVNVGTLSEVFESGAEIDEAVLLKAGLVAKMNEILAGYNTLGCRLFSFIILSMSCHSLLA